MKSLLYAFLLSAGSFPFIASGQSAVLLRSGNFTPAQTVMGELNFQPSEVINGYYYRFIQFRQIPSDAERASLKTSGITLYNYVPGNTYMAAIPAKLNLRFVNNGNIYAIFPIEPLHKLDKFLATKEYPKWAMAGKDKIELVVTHHPNLNHAYVEELLKNEGVQVEHSLPQVDAFRVITSTQNIDKIAALPYLYFAEPWEGAPQVENLTGKTNHRSNVIATDYSNGLKYDGKGVNVAINDDGEIGPHIDFTGRIEQYVNYNVGDHGDHCSGILLGAGNINPTTRGMAPAAQLGVYGVGITPTQYQAFDSIDVHYKTKKVRITSTSYGNGNNAGYTTLARLMDRQANNMTELTHVFSAGNSGWDNFGYGAGTGWGTITGGHKQAKNVIAVANINDVDVLAGSSSRGPAYDGRIKPDIAAVGTNVYSTLENNTYDYATGTSMACPAIAGVSAQLYQAYKEQNNGQNPDAALVKATMLNTADDLGNPGPDYRFGWGRVNAARAYDLLEKKQYKRDTIMHGATKSFTIPVPANVAELRVMVYWSDYEATANAAKALVNDLDMNIVDPQAQTILPWTLNPTPVFFLLNAPAVQGKDTLNNVEQVTIENPTAGNYTVNVTGQQVAQGPQSYYIVYEFVKDELTLTYPIGGESFIPSQTEIIRWDAYGFNGTFDLDYSTDNGTTWNSIATNISIMSRSYNWTPPATVTGKALVRITRGAQSDQSHAPFTIIDATTAMYVDWVCVDSMQVSYDAVNGAAGYIVTVLGDSYMDSVGFSTTTTCVVKNIDTRREGWFSVRAVTPDGGQGQRAIAREFPAVPVSCTAPEDIAVVGFTTPAAASSLNCITKQVSSPVALVIRNNSFSPLTSLPLKYTFNNGAVQSATYNGNLGTGYYDTVVFSQPISISTAGTYDVKGWLELVSAQNSITTTDTIVLQKTIVTSTPKTQFYMEQFSSFTPCSTDADCGAIACTLANDWINEPNNKTDDIDWRAHVGPTPNRALNAQTGPASGNGGANDPYLYLEASDCSNHEAQLVSPCITLNWPNAYLQFSYHMFGSNMGELHIDLYDGTTWVNDITPAITGNKGDNWITSSPVILNNYLTKTIALRFRGITGNGENSDMAIDNVMVGSYGDVAQHEIQHSQYSVHPNPANGIFKLTAQDVNGNVSITVTDISGKVISSVTATPENGLLNTNIDLTNTAPGVYLMAVRNGTSIANIKLVKL